MGRYKSPQEVKEEYLLAMGRELGSLYYTLYNDVTWLHAKWLEYRKLYGESEERVAVLRLECHL